MELFEELSFRDKIRKVTSGLRQPKDSGAYKYAKLQVIRLLAPLAAVVVPCIVAGMLMVFATMAPQDRPPIEVTILQPEAIEDLDDIEELLQEPLEPPEPIELDLESDVTVQSDSVVPEVAPTEFSPQPTSIDAVAVVKSPVIMKGIYGSRNPGARGVAIKEFGGSGYTEGAVLRALRWLKKVQNEDGSWSNNPLSTGVIDVRGSHPMAMTGLALLTFLAHGETPASEEFGATVEKAIRYLLESQDGDGRWKSSYTHAIATYAVCEAYALTKIPMIRAAAEAAIDVVIQGQNATGGWNYPLRPCERDDTSVMGWCVQALKAGKMAGLENEGLDQAMKDALRGFKKNEDPKGGFGYATTDESGPPATGLTGVGVLCMQLLGHGRKASARKGLLVLQMDRHAFSWDKTPPWRNIYYWYYTTQAKFHAGGKVWNDWNRLFAKPLVRAQTVLKGEGIDGKDMGYWVTDTSVGVVMDTTLCALQLQVYYRYLPTFRPPKEAVEEEEILSEDDINIEITI